MQIESSHFFPFLCIMFQGLYIDQNKILLLILNRPPLALISLISTLENVHVMF